MPAVPAPMTATSVMSICMSLSVRGFPVARPFTPYGLACMKLVSRNPSRFGEPGRAASYRLWKAPVVCLKNDARRGWCNATIEWHIALSGRLSRGDCAKPGIRVILAAYASNVLDVILPFHRSADGVLWRRARPRPGQSRRGARRDDCAAWKLGLRQDDVAALDCRLGGPRAGA